jgi:sugar lactone lactonase YvrE
LFRNPFGLALDAQGNVYIADRDNSRVRRLAADLRTVTTEAGNGLFHFFGEGSPANLAFLDTPTRALPDGSGRLYVSNTNGGAVLLVETGTDGTRRIRTITARAADENARSCRGDDLRLEFPTGLALDSDRSLFIADYGPDVVYRVTGDGRFTIYAGTCRRGFSGDGGLATLAKFDQAWGLSLDHSNNLYICDASNHRIRKIDATTGIVTTFAGNGGIGYSGDYGPAIDADLGLNDKLTILFNSNNEMYFSSTSSENTAAIRKINSSAIINTEAVFAASDTAAPYPFISAMYLDKSNTLYFALDYDASIVYKISLNQGPGEIICPALPISIFTPNGDGINDEVGIKVFHGFANSAYRCAICPAFSSPRWMTTR